MLDQEISDTELDGLFHALADANRRALIERLSTSPASVSDLPRPFDLTLSAVLQHLQILEAAGIATSEKHGRTRTYKIQPLTLSAVERWVADRRSSWQRRFDRLAEVLEGDQVTEPISPDQLETPS